MAWIKRIGMVAASIYLGVLATLFLMQREMLYPLSTARVDPVAAGLPAAREIEIPQQDGSFVVAWQVPPRNGKPTILYFHGNGGSLQHRVYRFIDLTLEGYGLLALSYPGYGGSQGSPSEDSIMAAAFLAYDQLRTEGVQPNDIVVYGNSLGSGVAVQLAAQRPVGGLILEAAYTSAVEVAQDSVPIFPVWWLMKDKFRSDLWVGKISAPTLMIHGRRDQVVPIEYGEKLSNMIRTLTRFVSIDNAGHDNLWEFGAGQEIAKFLSEVD